MLAKTSDRLPVPSASPLPATGFDPGFNARWDSWVARGHVHEQEVQRKFMLWLGLLATAGAIVATFLL